jgi:hypothetical protein
MPASKPSQTLVKQLLEDNRRHRRITPDEEKALLDAAPAHLQPLMVVALARGTSPRRDAVADVG